MPRHAESKWTGLCLFFDVAHLPRDLGRLNVLFTLSKRLSKAAMNQAA